MRPRVRGKNFFGPGAKIFAEKFGGFRNYPYLCNVKINECGTKCRRQRAAVFVSVPHKRISHSAHG